ncbi:MAG TPA: PBP1A family penicillin-binding protein, partial [Thermaerobacter sp.]
REIARPEEIPQHLRQAVVAAEDARFYHHHGFDPIAIGRALVRNLRAGKVVEGGSSITQQLARTLYDLSLRRTLSRKSREAFLTLKLETRFNKDQILNMYLNQVYFGRGAYGVKVAAREYFGKPLESLTLAESATLAAFIRGPEIYWRDPERARGRRDWVLERMAELGMISREEARRAQAEPLRLRPPGEAGRAAPYFVDFVRGRLTRELPEVASQLATGGFRIYTTLDLDMQRAAQEAAARLDTLVAPLEEHDGVPQPQVALVALDPATGGIRAMVGGRSYEDSRFNRAVYARRQPGSAFKPFLYTAVLAAGEPVTTPMACRASAYPGEKPDEPYEPKDFGPRPYHDAYLDIRRAVAISDNVVAVEWMNRIKPRRVAALARRMGVESPLNDQHLGLALGESSVTVLEMARAYASLANLGQRVEPFAILRVEAPDGTVLYERRPARERVLEPEVAWLMTDVLKSVFDPALGGTARSLGIGRPAAGKTGTTDDAQDLWFVGYTPDLVAAVWVGADYRAPVRTRGGGAATGGSTAGRIWQAFMEAALQDRPARDWPRPAGLVRATACTLTGPLASPRFEWRDEWFLAGRVPAPNCLALLERVAPDGGLGVPGQPRPGFPGVPGGEGAAPPDPGFPGLPRLPGPPALPGLPGGTPFPRGPEGPGATPEGGIP